MGASSIDTFITGIVKGKEVHKTTWSLPALLPQEECVEKIESCFEEALINYGAEKPKLFNKKHQREWSEEYSYKHIHTGEHCNFESYVAEYLILRWTDAFKMEKPSYKFWTVGDKYHDMFIRNMKAARGLKKKFKEHIILEAIKSNHFKKIYHIGLKHTDLEDGSIIELH